MTYRPVSLPMYVEKPDAVDAFWRGLRRHMVDAGLRDIPRALTSPPDLEEHWLDPELLLSQTCGYPLVRGLARKVTLVGVPRFGVAGFSGVTYSSRILVRAGDAAESIEDLRGRRAAYNAVDSQSGYNALRALVAPHAVDGRFFGGVVETGGHLSSLGLLQSGEADVAAIDCVTYAHAEDDGLARGLRTLCFSDAAPGLPLITSNRTSSADVARLQAAFAAACADPSLAACRAALHLVGFEVVEPEAYGVCLDMEGRASAHGYPMLA